MDLMGCLLRHTSIKNVHKLDRSGSFGRRYYEKIRNAKVQQTIFAKDYAWREFTDASLFGSSSSRWRKQYDSLYAASSSWLPWSCSYLQPDASKKSKHSCDIVWFPKEKYHLSNLEQIIIHWVKGGYRGFHWFLFDSRLVPRLVLPSSDHDVLADSAPQIYDQHKPAASIQEDGCEDRWNFEQAICSRSCQKCLCKGPWIPIQHGWDGDEWWSCSIERGSRWNVQQVLDFLRFF